MYYHVNIVYLGLWDYLDNSVFLQMGSLNFRKGWIFVKVI